VKTAANYQQDKSGEEKKNRKGLKKKASFNMKSFTIKFIAWK